MPLAKLFGKEAWVSKEMDIEAENRGRLENGLAGANFILEEVWLCHAARPSTRIRADICAVFQLEDELVAFAFEVKRPTEKWEFKNWSAALKQAFDYVDCNFCDPRMPPKFENVTIRAAFVFPFPSSTPGRNGVFPYCRGHDVEAIRGAYLFAQHLMVGRVVQEGNSKKISIRLGTDIIWDTGQGFRPKATKKLLVDKRLGSGRIHFG